MDTRQSCEPAIAQRESLPFHRKGVAYFWFLNDRCDWDDINRQLEVFASVGHVTALCLHPRHGLLFPYGGEDWFELIKRICLRAAELDVKIWLYDEDPFPSGHAGGRILMEHPELSARGIRQYAYDPSAQEEPELFCFPAGMLIWCGLVDEETGNFHDCTSRVGVLRRKWSVHEHWDSRFFYPDTPLYTAPFVETTEPEYALRIPEIPIGMRLIAQVARRAAFAEWSPYGDFIDLLNPRAAELFLQSTHEQYRRVAGDMFGAGIEAIFTDEPKFFDPNPWTPGLFEDFQQDRGYDIRPFLHYLFSNSMTAHACRTRLEYRYYIGERFRQAWLRPVARWCQEHKLKFIGHISPEDDPVEQAMCLTNLLPLMKEFDLCGIDLIIPAVGDASHPLLSVGVTCATSIAQQQNKQGVMSETGYFSNDLTAAQFGTILLWQCMMGVTTPLLHSAFLSTRGARQYEQPDFGPEGKFWPGMHSVRQQVVAVQQQVHGARQIAPVAILWPIRSFNMACTGDASGSRAMRQDFTGLLARCLDRQVGVHVLDEGDLTDIDVIDGWACLGSARYRYILIPSVTVLHAVSIAALQRIAKEGIQIILAGNPPLFQQEDHALTAVEFHWCEHCEVSHIASVLPRLVVLDGDTADIRCTAWESCGRTVRLLMNIGHAARTSRFDGQAVLLEPGVVYLLDENTRGEIHAVQA